MLLFIILSHVGIREKLDAIEAGGWTACHKKMERTLPVSSYDILKTQGKGLKTETQKAAFLSSDTNRFGLVVYKALSAVR